MNAWYALYTKPNSEVKVARTLKVRGFEAYLPLLPSKPGERIEPLFPTYLFVQCDLETLGIASLQWIPGLRRIVGFAGRPAVVPDAAIKLMETELRRIEEQGGLPTHSFKPGDEVVIEEGPLAGLRGVFQGPLGPAERVHILIDFLGQSNKAEVEVAALRPAAEVEERERLRRRGTRGHGRRISYDDSPR
jgi:transcriptional antiterminator RfaH